LLVNGLTRHFTNIKYPASEISTFGWALRNGHVLRSPWLRPHHIGADVDQIHAEACQPP